MENLNLVLLSGGYFECTPAWNSEPYGKDKCYKLYFPVEGRAKLFARGEWHQLEAGNVYLINGFMLDKYCCDQMMKVYWLHFIPESHLLTMILNTLDPICCWESGHPLINSIQFAKLPSLFDNPYSPDNKPLAEVSLSMECYVSSVLLMLISDMTGKQKAASFKTSNDVYLKLKPAIDYINGHYRESLKLDAIAQQAFINPAYFQRLFKKHFMMTPGSYILMVRINEACRLLMKTALSIREISDQLGFCNQFYFSNVFKSHFHKTPLEYRKTILAP